MNKLSQREKHLLNEVFNRCSKIAHSQAGNADIDDASAVNSVWRMAAIAIHQSIEADRVLLLGGPFGAD